MEGGTLWDFPTSILSQNSKKVEGGDPLKKKKFREKSLAVPKKIGRGDPLVSPGMVWYAGKQEKPFWFSSLDQIVHFGPIIFCRTFKNYFGQFVWIEKKKKKKKKKSHYNSRVSLHEAPTKNGVFLQKKVSVFQTSLFGTKSIFLKSPSPVKEGNPVSFHKMCNKTK